MINYMYILQCIHTVNILSLKVCNVMIIMYHTVEKFVEFGESCHMHFTIDILHLIGIGNGLRALKYACFEFPYMYYSFSVFTTTGHSTN